MAGQPQRGLGRREQVLQALRDNGEAMSITAIAARLGVHPNTVRFHLDTLVDNGQIERTTSEAGNPGRPAQLFGPAPGMDPMGPRRYRGLAKALVHALAADADPGRRGVEAGRAWGSVQAGSRPHPADPVSKLVDMLDEMGFAPDAPGADDSSQIALRNCPFLELALDRADVVCPIHLGLMQGAMQSWDSPVSVDKLDAFVQPDLCVAHLGPRPPADQ